MVSFQINQHRNVNQAPKMRYGPENPVKICFYIIPFEHIIITLLSLIDDLNFKSIGLGTKLTVHYLRCTVTW